MSMHLVGPWLSTTGKKKGKTKYRNAEAARKARQAAEEWEELKKKYDMKETKKISNKNSSGTLASSGYHLAIPKHRETPHIPSRNPQDMSPCLKPAQKVYTGTLIKGIATMHKSNAVPIINEEQAIEISRMRR